MSFDDADFYTTDRDAERFTAQSPEKAIGESPPVRCPVTVYAHKRGAVSAEWVGATALALVEELIERYEDEYDGSDDGRDDWLNGDAEKVTGELSEQMRRVVAWFSKNTTPWRCNPCGERAYTKEEVEAMDIEVEVTK